MRASTKRDEVLIGDDGELVIPEQFSDAAISLRVALPDLYLVDPAHEVFFGDDPQYLRRPARLSCQETLQTYSIIIVIYGAFILGLISMILAGQIVEAFSVILGVGSVCGASLLAFWLFIKVLVRLTSSKEDLLRQRGKLIKGYISTFEHIGDYDEIDYQFLTPDGRKFTSHDRVYRNLRTTGFNAQNQDKFIPEEGTPVAVLYLNDKIFKLL